MDLMIYQNQSHHINHNLNQNHLQTLNQAPNTLIQQLKQTSSHLFSNNNDSTVGNNGSMSGHVRQSSQPVLVNHHLTNVQNQGSLHRPSKSVIHVRENSMDELDALFDPNKWSKRTASNVPFSKRNLPQSFFRPPETGTKTPKLNSMNSSNNHSRQSSIDQTNMHNNSNYLSQQHLLLQQKLANLSNSPFNNTASQNFHSRSISEPVVTNMPPYTPFSNQPQPHQPYTQHAQYQQNTQTLQQQFSLPYGWQAAKTETGQRYFIK